MNLNTSPKDWIPPVFLKLRNHLLNRNIQWTGDYSSWSQAQNHSLGYAENVILQTLMEANQRLRQGEIAGERDGFPLPSPWVPWEILASVLHVKSTPAPMNLLDFGGALGSMWYQLNPWLPKGLTISIVEQQHFVEAGRREFETDSLRFFLNCKEASHWQKPDILVLSSVLQYLENPWQLIPDALLQNVGAVLVDRTPIHEAPDRICVQKVPAWIYKSSYPCRIFSRSSLLKHLESAGLVAFHNWKNPDGGSQLPFRFEGYLFKRPHPKAE